MIIPAYTSVASEKTTGSPSRNFLLEVGPIKYAEAVRTLARNHKPREEQTQEQVAKISYVEPEPLSAFSPIAGKTADEIQQWLDIKNPSSKKN